MRVSLLAAGLLCSTLAQADLLDALKHYEAKDYAKARVEFSELLPLGNELAAFNLAAMYHNGQGTAADPVKALAYFQLADNLGDGRAAAIVSSLEKKLSAEQQQQAKALATQLVAAVQIHDLNDIASAEPNLPDVVQRQAPQYPEDAARSGLFGYSILRFVIDEEGNVPVVEVLGSFPDKVFDKTSIRALKQWKYAATGKKHQGKVVLNYSLGPVSESKVNKLIQQYKLVEYAVAGSPSHQYLLGSLLDLVSTTSFYYVHINKDLPVEPDAQLPEQLFDTSRSLYSSTRLDGFYGTAEVKTDAKGMVTQVVSSSAMDLQQASTLLTGKVLDEDANLGHYWLYAEPNQKTTRFQPILELSQMHSANYWWSMAAKNGNLNAQRQLAALNAHWEKYLLQQNDPQVQTWSGVREILQGDKAAGQLLLDKAIAQNYATAAELKAAL